MKRVIDVIMQNLPMVFGTVLVVGIVGFWLAVGMGLVDPGPHPVTRDIVVKRVQTIGFTVCIEATDGSTYAAKSHSKQAAAFFAREGDSLRITYWPTESLPDRVVQVERLGG